MVRKLKKNYNSNEEFYDRITESYRRTPKQYKGSETIIPCENMKRNIDILNLDEELKINGMVKKYIFLGKYQNKKNDLEFDLSCYYTKKDINKNIEIHSKLELNNENIKEIIEYFNIKDYSVLTADQKEILISEKNRKEKNAKFINNKLQQKGMQNAINKVNQVKPISFEKEQVFYGTYKNREMTVTRFYDNNIIISLMGFPSKKEVYEIADYFGIYSYEVFEDIVGGDKMTRIEETYVNDYYKITEDEKIEKKLIELEMSYEDYTYVYTRWFNYYLTTEMKLLD